MPSNMVCCRTCMSKESLNPIFVEPQRSREYSDILYICTGLDILQSDSLPQMMCSNCINSINTHMNFRKTCQLVQDTLIRSLKNKRVIKSYDNQKTDENMINADDMIHSDSNNVKKENDYKQLTISVKEVLNKRMKITLNNLKDYNKEELNYTEVKEERGIEKKQEERVTSKCKLCDKEFESKIALNNHLKKHSGLNVVCEHCGKKFINKRRLLMHCKAKHGYEKTDKCSYCDYKGSNAELVKIHERLHTGERPYVCRDCGATFLRRSSYLQHTPIHLPDKTVQCDECPALFKSVTLMRIHKYRHKKRSGTQRDSVGAPLDRG